MWYGGGVRWGPSQPVTRWGRGRNRLQAVSSKFLSSPRITRNLRSVRWFWYVRKAGKRMSGLLNETEHLLSPSCACLRKAAVLWKVTRGICVFPHLWHCGSEFLPGSFHWHRRVHYFVFRLAFAEIDRGAKPLGNLWKAIRTEVTWNKEKEIKGWLFPWEWGGADCPFPCPSHWDHIFDIQAASTNNLTDFPARVFSTRHSQLWSWLATSIWATLACLPLKWTPLPTICLVGILHMACTVCSRQSPWRPRLGPHACSRPSLVTKQSWCSAKMSQSAGPPQTFF